MNTATTLKAVELEKFLVRASAIIKASGYVSNGDVKGTDKKSTGMLALEWADDNKPKEIISVTFDYADKVTGKEVAEWMAGIDTSHLSNQDYLFNLAHIGVTKTVTERTMGYAASAIGAFEREKSKGADAAKGLDEMASALGNPGAKIHGIKVVFKEKSSFNSRFGLCYKYQFESVIGNYKIVWITSVELPNLTAGSSFTLSGTVKKYSSFKSRHECEVKNAKLTNG